jgi:histidine triad (HIT) family protein
MTADFPTDSACVFCRIIAGKTSATIRYESEHVIAFDDHYPKTPTHVLICPKGHYPTFLETPDDVLARLNAEVKTVAAHLGLGDRGFRLVVNNGHESGQLIYHLHFHLLSGRPMRGL